MAALIQTGYPGYSAVNNTSAAPHAVKSAGRVNNAEQHEAVIATERAGKLNLTQFGLIKIPREVLFLQDESSAKVKNTLKGDQVQSSSKSDLDEERSLERAGEKDEDALLHLDPLKPRREKTDTPLRQDSGTKKAEDPFLTEKNAHETDTKKLDVREVTTKDASQQTATDFAAFAEAEGAQEAARQHKADHDDEWRDSPITDRVPARTETHEPARASVVGTPNVVYQTVQDAAGANTSGQNLSVLA